MSHEKEKALLRRSMGLGDVVLFFITAGVNLQWVATAAVVGSGAIPMWLLACATMSLPLALCVVELSSRYPQEGGIYVWSKRAFGDFGAFMAGWTYWISNLPYFPGVLYFAAGNALFVVGERFRGLTTSPTYFILASFAGLALGTVLNLVGLEVGKWLNNVGAIARWLATLGLIGLGVLALVRFGPASDFSLAAMVPAGAGSLKNLLFWSTITFALTGLESASFMGEEIQDARRTLPRAIYVAAPLIALIYVLGTVSVLVALPSSELSGLQGIMEAMAAAGRRLGVEALTPLLAVLITLSALGSVGAWLGATARLPFVAGIDDFLPPAFARIHPRWRTPHVALLVQAGIAVACVLLGQAGSTVRGAYDILVSLTVISFFIPFLFLFAATVALQRETAGPDVIRVPGGPRVAVLLGGIGFLTTSVSIVLAFFPSQGETRPGLAVAKVAGATLVMVGSGVLVYRAGRRRQLAAAALSGDPAGSSPASFSRAPGARP